MLATLLVCCAVGGAASDTAAPLPLVPRPAVVTRLAGTIALSPASRVTLSDTGNAQLRDLRQLATEILRTNAARGERASPGRMRLMLDALIPGGPEAYHLEAGAGTLTITAAGPAGLFYGLQTLRQLLPGDGSGIVPAVRIDDAPRFRYRGMHLDVGRHLFPVAFIERYIDLLARYKLNTFHWHLTEDQGWRLEIRKYPRLTEVGAWRRETPVGKQINPYVGDGRPYGGFYTQDEVRGIVAYAAARHVTIIPEIEMPGHSVAALAAYPELACTPGPFAVGTTWGVFDDIYCPSERTFAFLGDVLTEVMELFPSPYIHIGGDEVPKRRWKESPLAQDVIRREGLKDEAELQSWFIRRIERFLSTHGRRLIGWDEILEGGLAPEATVMSWRGTAGGIAAARQGHDVIMSPFSHLYFDYYQGQPANEPLAIGGYAPLELVYAFEPVPDELTEAEAAHILGAQANVWTEYVPSAEQVEYMVLPRMLALAEVAWSPREVRSWEDFARRLPRQLAALDALGVNYRIPEPGGLEADRLVLADSHAVTLTSLIPTARIVYTTDAPGDLLARVYAGPVPLALTDSGVTVTARLVLPGGRASPARSARFRRAVLRPALAIGADTLAAGLAYTYHEGTIPRAAGLADYAPLRGGGVPSVMLPGDEREEHFGVRLTGWLRVPADAVYEFGLTSDDGSLLSLDGEVVIDHDGPHAPEEKRGSTALAAGFHAFDLRYYQATGGKALALRVRQGEGPWMPLAGDWLYRRR